ncbi:MAG: hypothetical protein AAF653_07795, partial [Chloroflexota bacterium]
MIYMTYHRQGKEWRTAVLVGTRKGVYVSYQTLIEGETLLEHWLPDELAAMLYTEQRLGIPISVWLNLSTSSIPYELEILVELAYRVGRGLGLLV